MDISSCASWAEVTLNTLVLFVLSLRCALRTEKPWFTKEKVSHLELVTCHNITVVTFFTKIIIHSICCHSFPTIVAFLAHSSVEHRISASYWAEKPWITVYAVEGAGKLEFVRISTLGAFSALGLAHLVRVRTLRTNLGIDHSLIRTLVAFITIRTVGLSCKIGISAWSTSFLFFVTFSLREVSWLRWNHR